MDPIRIHMENGLRLLKAEQANVSTWEGLSVIRTYTTTFLQSFFQDVKCCYGVFSNMGFSKEEVEPYGGWEGWLSAHENDYGSPHAVFDNVLLDVAEGVTTLTSLRNRDYNGSAQNPTLSIPMDVDTLEEDLTQVVDFGFLNFPSITGHTQGLNPLSGMWRTVHRYDMQPGEFRFTPIFVWTLTAPFCLKVLGVVPLYDNTELPNSTQLEQLKSGTLSWGRRAGAWVVGFKLYFLSAHLASMNLKDGFMYLVDKESGALVATSDTEISVLSDPEDVNNVAAVLVQDAAHPLISALTAHLTQDGNYTAVPNRIADEVVSDVRRFILTFDFAFYGLDLKGVYTVERAVMLKDLEEQALDGMLVGMIINVSTCAVFFFLLFCWASRKVQLLYAEQNARKDAKERRVHSAWSAASDCRFSMVLVRLDRFMTHGRLLSFEQVQHLGHCTFLNNHKQVTSFTSEYVTFFFSHQWLGWSDPDPKVEQYPLMVSAALQYINEKGKEPHEAWVWVDYFSIPQQNNFMQLLAIESLHVYASVCEAFVVIAPSTVHGDSSAVADYDSYCSRGWCRLEQLSRLSAERSGGMFLCTKEGALSPLGKDSASLALAVFNGTFSCCQLGHRTGAVCDKFRLADTVLGLYTVVGRSDVPHCRAIFAELQARRVEVFPKEIFHDILNTADELLRAGKLPEVGHPMLHAMRSDTNDFPPVMVG